MVDHGHLLEVEIRETETFEIVGVTGIVVTVVIDSGISELVLLVNEAVPGPVAFILPGLDVSFKEEADPVVSIPDETEDVIVGNPGVCDDVESKDPEEDAVRFPIAEVPVGLGKIVPVKFED